MMSRLQCIGKSPKVTSKDAEVPVIQQGPCSLESGAIESVKKVSRANLQQEERNACPPLHSESAVKKTSLNQGSNHSVSQIPACTDVTTHVNELSKCSSSAVTEPATDTSYVKTVCETETPGTQRGVIVKCPSDQLGSNTDQTLRGGESENEKVEGDEDEGDEGRAPLELFAEFLKSVMVKDYPLAKKLCQMILIYEPDNPEATHFLPLIEKKLQIAREDEEEGTESSDDDEEEDDDVYVDDSDSYESDGESNESSEDFSSFSQSSSDVEEEEQVGDSVAV